MILYKIDARSSEDEFITVWVEGESEAIKLARYYDSLGYYAIIIVHLGECSIDIQGTCYYVTWRS